MKHGEAAGGSAGQKFDSGRLTVPPHSLLSASRRACRSSSRSVPDAPPPPPEGPPPPPPPTGPPPAGKRGIGYGSYPIRSYCSRDIEKLFHFGGAVNALLSSEIVQFLEYVSRTGDLLTPYDTVDVPYQK